MRIEDRHRRLIPCDPAAAGDLIERLSSADDVLWPRDRWPPMRLDRPLGPGASGGHSFIRYHVEEHLPGERIVFRFDGPPGLTGIHRFEITAHPPGTEIEHAIEGGAAWWFVPAWLAVIRPLHTALIEDALDRAESFCAGEVANPNRWSAWVRILLRLMRRRRSQTSGLSST